MITRCDLYRLTICCTSLLVVACATTIPATSSATSAPVAIRVLNASAGTAPAAGTVTRTTVYETPKTVTQVLRLAPGSRIAEHHHPFYDETFMVQQGSVALTLNGTTYQLGAGDFITMPAGTVISGNNPGDTEAHVVVAFSNTGMNGPLSVLGSHH